MKIAICDDVKYQQELIEKEIKKILTGIGQSCEFYVYDNGNILVDEDRKESFDIICLDIEMPKVSGFEIAEQIRQENENKIIIFITAKNDLVYDSFSFHPFSFVRKDHLQYDMQRTIKSLSKRFDDNEKYITLTNTRETVYWRITDIIYLESVKNNVVFHRKNDTFEMRAGMAERERTLSEYDFIRIHSGFIVNLRYAEHLGKTQLLLTTGEVLPVSRNKYSAIKDRLQDFMLKERR